MGTLLEVEGLRVRFHTTEGVVHAVNGISYSMQEGETVALVGESGCGKSVSMMSILRLIPCPPGEVAEGGRSSGSAICCSSRVRLGASAADRSAWCFRIPWPP
jgi:oligopeptide transport system ATP-binding protein